ncbi:uncharacterized protein LOC126880760 [Diabrotica virgifera virgifera]|uniref:C2H2-type domain-containing protein n=1 Tax=Diabrotica virgifera virgifera TaxID=50390 RepID=A0ABM5JS62_DIAVI|nr:uncharacterized protein LOC126880760 [Diabrotica virgifera virgifera]
MFYMKTTILNSIHYSDKEKELTKSKSFKYECENCQKHFNDINNFKKHKKTHESSDPKKQHKCILCNAEELTKSEIHSHFKVVHEIVLTSEVLKFPTCDDFHTWKNQIERTTQSSFINEHGSYNTKDYKRLKYVCHRSGLFKSQSKGLRHLKTQGSHKINGYCPAEIIVKLLNDGTCEVEFVAQHIGHNENLGHLNLNQSEKEDLAAKIALKVPFESILDEVRNSVSGSEIDRLHLLKKKDLANIQACFNLNKESIRHVQDAVSVEAWIKEVENSGCVLFYKPQDTLSEDYKELKETDFILIIMNKAQREI